MIFAKKSIYFMKLSRLYPTGMIGRILTRLKVLTGAV